MILITSDFRETMMNKIPCFVVYPPGVKKINFPQTPEINNIWLKSWNFDYNPRKLNLISIIDVFKKIYKKKREKRKLAPKCHTQTIFLIYVVFFVFLTTHIHICLKCFFFTILCREYGCNFSRWDINQIAIRYYPIFRSSSNCCLC